jgi:hypothetical protein
MDSGPPPPDHPVLQRKWTEGTDPIRRVMIAKKASKKLGHLGRRLLRSAMTHDEPLPPWTIQLVGRAGKSVQIDRNSSLADLYTAISAVLPPGTSFKLIRDAKFVCLLDLAPFPTV